MTCSLAAGCPSPAACAVEGCCVGLFAGEHHIGCAGEPLQAAPFLETYEQEDRHDGDHC